MHSVLCNPIFKRPVVNLVLLAVILAVLFGMGLGDRPYSAPSESRYIEIGREMAESGDYVTPRLDYVKYFEKPPLFYWVQALSTKYFGLGPFISRVPTALFAILFCLLTYALGDMLYGRMTGWLSSLVLATSLYMFALSRIVLVDVPVSFFLVATLYTFMYALRAPEGHKRTIALYCMYAAAACAVLTKGLIGAVLPGSIFFLWMALTGNWKILTNIRLPGGIVLFLIIAVPWHVLVSERNPEFLHFYFIHEHFERYLTKTHGRYQPDWFFLVVLVAGLFPWTGYVFQAAASELKGFWTERKQNAERLLQVAWIGFILFFFSFSDSKLIPYILPIFPPIAVFIGHYFANAWEGKNVKCFGIGLTVTILFFVLMAAAPSILPVLFDPNSKVMEAVKQSQDAIHDLSIVALIAAGALLVTCIQGQTRHVIICLIIAAALIIQFGDTVAEHYNKDSMKDIALNIRTMDKPGDEVVLYDEYNQDLPVYLQRRVSVVQWKGTELNFGARQENTSAWMISEDEFWKRWMKGDHIMFVVMRTDTLNRLTDNGKKTLFELHFYPITQSGRNILFMNQMPEQPKP